MEEANWTADGMTLYFSPGPDPVVYVGLHNATVAQAVADAHNAALAELRRALAVALDELERHQAANAAAVQVLLQHQARIAELESQLGQERAAMRTMEAELAPLRELRDDVQHWCDGGGDARDLRYVLETLEKVRSE